MNIKEKIIKTLEGDSKEEIEEAMLVSFGFVWVTDIGTHADGGLLITQGLEKEYRDWQLWVDWKKKRILLYDTEKDYSERDIIPLKIPEDYVLLV